MFFNGCEYFMGTTGDGDVSDCFNLDEGGTSIRTENEDCVAKCNCLDSDRTGAYIHCLIPRTDLADSTLRDNADVGVDIAAGFTFNDDCGYLSVGRAGSIPFVSEKPGAYGRSNGPWLLPNSHIYG